MSGPPTATALRALMRRTIRAVRDIESASQRTTYREYVHASWRRGALADTPMTARNLRNTAVEEVTWMEGLHRHRAAAQAARNSSTAAGVARTAAPPPPPPPPGRTNGEAFVRRTLAAAAAGVGAGVAYWYATDEGLRRSAKFWSAAGPIYAKYRFVANVVPAAQQEAWYAPLDKQHAPETLAIIRDLRGFYIKIGQIGSTRTDFLAREYTDSMATLQDDAPSEPFATVLEVIEAELGAPWHTVFKTLDAVPLGAASIGQAHRGTLHDGSEVVVKIMYETAERFFEGDVETLRTFCGMTQPEHLPLFDEIKRNFATEFDYRGEAANMTAAAGDLARTAWWRDGKISAPRPLFASKRVLVMEKVEGAKLVEALTASFEAAAAKEGLSLAAYKAKHGAGGPVRLTRDQLVKGAWLHAAKAAVRGGGAAGFDVAGLVATLHDVHAHALFANGLFNADPHPGNILYDAAARKGLGSIGLIDYGQVKRNSVDERLKLARLIVAIDDRDNDRIVRCFTAMGHRTKNMDYDVLLRTALCFYDRDDPDSLGGKNVQLFLEDMNAKDPVVEAAEPYILAGRMGMMLRGLAYSLGIAVSTAEMWRPEAEAFLRANGEQRP